MTRISTAERTRIFGSPCDTRNLVLVRTPWGMRCQVHRLIADVFLDACQQAKADVVEWRPKRVDHYACRTIRGASTPSLHAYGLAFDFFATAPDVPPPGGVWTPDNGVPAAFARCFTERGFTWGATFTRKDVPHIEWAAGRPGSFRPRTAEPEPPYEPVIYPNTLNGVPVRTFALRIPTDPDGDGSAPVCPVDKFISATPFGGHDKYAGDADTIAATPISSRDNAGTMTVTVAGGPRSTDVWAWVTVAD